MDAHLVLDRADSHRVALADRAVLVDLELRHDEQRDALDAGRCIRQSRQHQVDDIVGEVVFAGGDEDLGAGDRGSCRRHSARRAVLSRPRSVPHCGSVRHMVPVQRPSVIGVRKASCCHFSPCTLSASQAPCESIGKLLQDMFAASIISLKTTPIVSGKFLAAELGRRGQGGPAALDDTSHRLP